jgi:hypothetical protein
MGLLFGVMAHHHQRHLTLIVVVVEQNSYNFQIGVVLEDICL